MARIRQKTRHYWSMAFNRWLVYWLGGVLLLFGWDAFFLNPQAFGQLSKAFFNTISLGLMVVFWAVFLGWLTSFLQAWLSDYYPTRAIVFVVLKNQFRSVPQILGIMLGYIILSRLQVGGNLRSPIVLLFWMAFIIGLFIFPEVSDLLEERIAYFKKSAFFDALLLSGVSPVSIINREIIWKNSRLYLLNKMVAVFSMAVFLLCSVDFVFSVGLSNTVQVVNFPRTLGSLLAKIDSKQDILAMGSVLLNPAYLPRIFFNHLQGFSVTFLIVFTMIAWFKIGNEIARRFRL
jgi:hypothetical protein